LNNWDELLPNALFVYNSTHYQPYELLYGRELNIPVKLKCYPEPRYNYDDYVFDMKEKMQIAHKIAKENLIKGKI